MADQKFLDEALHVHNECRKHHGTPPLKLNKEICAVAQRWAEKMAGQRSLSHSQPSQRQYKGQQMGENIAMKMDSRMKEYRAAVATKQWYDEIKDYNFNTSSGRGVVGHFTQVVWKESKEFGIGRAQGPGGYWFVAANYYPAGNMMGHNPQNVLPPVNGAPYEIDAGPEPSNEAPGGGMRMDFGGGFREGPSLLRNAPMTTTRGSGKVSKSTSTKTQKVTDSKGRTVTKKITTETITDVEGNVTTNTTEEIISN